MVKLSGRGSCCTVDLPGDWIENGKCRGQSSLPHLLFVARIGQLGNLPHTSSHHTFTPETSREYKLVVF